MVDGRKHTNTNTNTHTHTHTEREREREREKKSNLRSLCLKAHSQSETIFGN